MCEWTEARYEPPLAEILNEPIIRALMSRDRVENREILDLLSRIAAVASQNTRAAA